jgi:plastocyanin
VRVLTATALAAFTVAAIFLPGAAASHTMNGSVGPGFTISLTGTGGLVPGETHTVVVNDQGTEHNFHLLGTSVITDIVGTGTSSFQVTLPAGQYTYVCDPHASIMRGTFTVGTPPPPPPPPKPVRLSGTVGPGAKIDLRRAGKRVTSLAAGVYLLVVSDRSAVDNFHLKGPGVNRWTKVAAKGTSRWTLRLKKGAHVYRSDAHAKLRRGFVVRAVG